MGSYGGFGSYQPYSNTTPYYGMGGFGGSYGYGYTTNYAGENLWQGVLGQTAETLGRLNNLLSMTGLLVDHISNHGKLLYSKGVELHKWYEDAKTLGDKHSEWLIRLGFQVEAGWTSNDSEEVRRRRMMIRRTRTVLIFGLIIASFYLFRKRRKLSRRSFWDSMYGPVLPENQTQMRYARYP
jgi:hypothetical protein